jgi:hypothetical protein
MLFKPNNIMIPKLIPIKREEDYHTHYLGQTHDGRLFFGYKTFVFPDGIRGDNWQQHRREYVVLHIFDIDGNHERTNYWFGGVTAEVDAANLQKRLDLMLGELGEYEFTDIAVKPFKVIIDEIVFGLIPNEDSETVELQPSSAIEFCEPWDGEYNT